MVKKKKVKRTSNGNHKKIPESKLLQEQVNNPPEGKTNPVVRKKVVKKKPKKVKSEEYVFKKNFSMKFLRGLLWVILICFFIKGIGTSLRPDQTQEVNKIVTDFKAEFNNYKDEDVEVLSFAQNFVKEYLTYKPKDDVEYKERLKRYVGSNISNMNNLSDLNGEAKVTYVKAYRKENYSENQIDVYVLADVLYSIQNISEDGATFEVKTDSSQVILKVPVFRSGKGQYIVEDIPCFVNDSMKTDKFEPIEYYATEITNDAVKSNIEKSLVNFLTAYYEQEQSVINYYLTKDADINNFTGLNKRFLFEDIDSLKCYQEEFTRDIVCIAKIKVKDGVNDATMYQQFNIIVRKDNDKYYVKDMNTKIVNLHINN